MENTTKKYDAFYKQINLLQNRITELEQSNEYLNNINHSLTKCVVDVAKENRNKALNALPDWYKLPTAEEGYRFLGQYELPFEGCERWWRGGWKPLSGFGYPKDFVALYSTREAIKNGEGNDLYRIKL